MAFGNSMTTQNKSKPSGTEQPFESQWMPTATGTRIFRVLPAVEDGSLVLTPRLSASGKPLTAGNKKNGEPLMGPEPAEEVAFLAAWWQVMVNGEQKPRRLILDINNRWGNPLWKHIESNYAKDAAERKALKTLFALNVFDMTPVIEVEGQVYYPDETGAYVVLAAGGSGRVVSNAVEGEPKPLNKVRILEGSTGQSGGKHLFQQLADLVGTVEDTEGLLRRLPEFDLKLITKGTGIKTVRSIRNTVNFKDLPEDVYQLPRYDLKTWLTPWPDEAIVALLAGADFDETIEHHNIQLFPQLDTNEFD